MGDEEKSKTSIGNDKTFDDSINKTNDRIHRMLPSLTMLMFVGFAFLTATTIVLSLIPVYIENQSVDKTSFILTSMIDRFYSDDRPFLVVAVRMSNYTLHMSRLLGKRDLSRSVSFTNTTGILTLDQAQMTMNASIQYALEQQLKTGDNRDRLNINILQMTADTSDPSNMSVTLDFFIVYTRECLSCDRHRQLIIFNQLCSNNLLSIPIRFLIENANLSYTLSDPVTVYTPKIPIETIVIVTRTVPGVQLINQMNNTNTNTSTQISNRFLANNYTLTVTTTKSNYFATLDEVGTQVSASQNDGPVPLIGAASMYPGLIQTIERQLQFTNGSNALNITINQVTLQFWYSNSTIRVIVDFLITFSTSCDNQCMNQRNNQLTNQLGNLTSTPISVQPANLIDGQVRISKNGVLISYTYSLTAQVITNFTGTIIRATSPVLTIV